MQLGSHPAAQHEFLDTLQAKKKLGVGLAFERKDNHKTLIEKCSTPLLVDDFFGDYTVLPFIYEGFEESQNGESRS